MRSGNRLERAMRLLARRALRAGALVRHVALAMSTSVRVPLIVAAAKADVGGA